MATFPLKQPLLGVHTTWLHCNLHTDIYNWTWSNKDVQLYFVKQTLIKD